MLLAPEYKSQDTRNTTGYRILSGVALVLGAGVLTLFTLALFILSQFLVATPDQLYHRTWQTAQWLIYDPTSMGDWQSWAHKFDEQIETDDDAVRFANEMLGSLKDPYTRLLSKEEVARLKDQLDGNFTGIGIVFDLAVDADGNPVVDAAGQPVPLTNSQGQPVIREVLPGSPAEKAGLKAGDAIKSVDGSDVSGKPLEEVVTIMRGKPGTSVSLELVRNGAVQNPVTVTREKIHLSSVTYKMLPGDIGYVKLRSFESVTATDEMIEALNQLSGARAIVLDLRNNPGGLVPNAVQIASLFMEKGTIVSIKQRVPGSDPGAPVYITERTYLTPTEMVTETTYSDDPGKAGERRGARKPNLLGKRPLIILVNGHSASASEMLTGSLKDNGVAVVVGETTYGKGIGQMVFPMPNGTVLTVTTLRYFTPAGTWLGDGAGTKNGIKPDHEVAPLKKSFEPGSRDDNQLGAALELLE